MDLLVSFAEGFMNLFQVGADNFVSWVTGIVPTVLILLIAMNTLIALIGQNRINRFAKFSAKILYLDIYGSSFLRSIYVR